jgi:ribonuclease P protein component
MKSSPARLRFRPANRIKSGADFARAYSQGSRARGKLMTVCVCANGTETTRLGLSIGKRVWKSAVRRNRVRRVFREAFRLALPELPAGLDVILIGSVPRLEPKLETALPELRKLVAKAHRRYLEKAAAAESE